MKDEITEEQLWSWIDRDGPELAEHLARCPESRARVDALRAVVRGVAAASALPARLPERIGSYVIKGLLGSGGMGVVYEAEQQSPPRRVALKVVRGGIVGERELRLFERETRALGRLGHPGIAAIYEGGSTEDGEPFLAMELVRGSPLDAFARGCRDRWELIDLVARIADAVQHAHEQGVIHRDLKPSNVIIDSSGSPRVLDFGLARIAGSGATSAWTSQGGGVLGTIPYMSPEQVRGGAAEVDGRTDVYSLGVILYEALAGRLPYEVGAVSLPEAARVICEEPPIAPSKLDRSLRGDLEAILLKALEKEPARRYPSAAALAADLRRHGARQPIEARSPGAVYRMRKLLLRHRGASILLTLIAALAGGILYLSITSDLDLASRITGQGPRLAPFSEVRWKGSTPHVKVGGRWYELVKVAGLRAGLLVEYAKQLDGDARRPGWMKRFAEDLPEVLSRLGVSPSSTVSLTLREPGSDALVQIPRAPMTEANRRAAWQARLRSPFSSVRWKGDEPEVQVGGSWYSLESIEGIQRDDILAFCRRINGEGWQSSFEIDLIDVLTLLSGNTPGDAVRLELRDASGTLVRLEGAAMPVRDLAAIRASLERASSVGLPRGEGTAP